MLRAASRPTALLTTAVVLVLVAVEIWALSLPVLAEWPAPVPGNWSARDVSVVLNVLLVAPLLTLLLVMVWRKSATAGGKRLVLPPWLKGWVRPRRLLFLLVPAAVAYVGRLDVGLGALLAGVAGLAIVVEVVAFGALAVKLAQLARATRASRRAGHSVPYALLISVRKVFDIAPPPFHLAMRLAVLEVAQLYYVTIGWLRPRNPSATTFTYHRRRDETTMIGLLLFMTIEAVPVHFVVHHFSAVAAWVITALHAYSVLWMLGFLTAPRQRPIQLAGGRLRLVSGLFEEAVVGLSRIDRAFDARDATEPPTVDASFGSRLDVVLELSAPVPVHGLVGEPAEARTVGLALDDPSAFLEALRGAGVAMHETALPEAD